MLENYAPILGWEDKYLINPKGEVIQLRQKSATGLDMQGHFLYLDDGKAVAKLYTHEILAATYGREHTAQPEEIMEFLDSIADKMLKKLTWAVEEDHAVVVRMPIILRSVKKVESKMKLYLLKDAKSIFDYDGKYGKLFLHR